MKNILSYPTKALKMVFFVNKLRQTILSPVSGIRNIIRAVVIKTIISIVKQIAKFSFFNEKNESTDVIIKQLNAIVDKEASTDGISKTLHFELTPDTILKEIVITNDKEILKRLRNVYGNLKNGLRNQIYDYLTENNFENVKSILDGVNGIVNSPTEIAGLEFVNSSVDIVEYNPDKKDFKLKFNFKFALKSI